MSKPYCGIRKPPKNRRAGTLDECLKSGQVRLYGRLEKEPQINAYLKEKQNLANEIAKLKRKKANDDKKQANKAIKEANQAIQKAEISNEKAKTAEKEAKKPAAKKTAAKKTAAKKTKK